ncbi:MAG: hypothetical protein MI757_11540 [Pirellulales bacterium]|nr:hypothetical protein [Pirellulales bacterium]
MNDSRTSEVLWRERVTKKVGGVNKPVNTPVNAINATGIRRVRSLQPAHLYLNAGVFRHFGIVKQAERLCVWIAYLG